MKNTQQKLCNLLCTILQSLDLESLRGFGPATEFDLVSLRCTIWVDVIDNGCIRVVVKVAKRFMLIGWMVSSQGFDKFADGHVEVVSPDRLD